MALPESLGFSPLHEALRRLLETCAFSDGAPDPWRDAPELDELTTVGLTIRDLRFLVTNGLVVLAQIADPTKSTRPISALSPSAPILSPTRVLLTSHGVAVAQTLPSVAPETRRRPVWNAVRRELSLEGHLVKRFRVPAANQVLILEAFEEEGWPELIDDPLPPTTHIDPRTRLHDTIKKLNGSQIHRLLAFHGNGRGDAVGWRLRAPNGDT